MHLRLDLHSFLPEFAVVKSAGTNDLAESYELCAGVRSGEIVVFDKAYVGFEHLHSLTQRGVFWVTRAKENTRYETVGQHSAPGGNIVRDVYIKLKDFKSSRKYPATLRLVEAIVEIDNKPRVMVFITNNMQWAASSICDLYQSRWGIEVFFKEIKQTLQLADLPGIQRERGALANMDRSIGLHIASLRGLARQMETHVHSSVYRSAWRSLESRRSVQRSRLLRDSTWRDKNTGSA
jgi:hypothetical protein